VIVGVPKEVKDNEYRVALTPAGVHELVSVGHEVLVQARAGLGSALPDDEFVAAGARIVGDADTVWADADLLLKVKEPVAEEYHRLREGLVLFTYLHLAADQHAGVERRKRGRVFPVPEARLDLRAQVLARDQERGRRRQGQVPHSLGAQAGEARIGDVVSAGGFTRFRRAGETPFNLVFEARP